MESWIETAHAAADAARQVTQRWYRSSPPTEHKDASSPIVTLADQDAEIAIRAVIRARHPEHGIHGEEGEDIAGAPGAPVWVIDPIDGTIAFASGKPLFTTLISVTQAGKSILGLIDQPIIGERWLGMSGRPSTLNGSPVHARGPVPLERSRLATSSPSYFGADHATAFQRLSDRVHVTSWGGDAYNYGLLATGTLDLVVESGLAWYDWAALVPVVLGSGGVITDWSGAPLRAGPSDVVAASSPALHAAALSILHQDLHRS